MIYRNGRIYEGHFINGEKYGKGKLCESDGRVKYIGNFKDDIYSGEGTMFEYSEADPT